MSRHLRLSPVATGITTVLISLAFIAAVLVSGIPGGPKLPLLPQGNHYTVELANADGLQPHASVEIAGVKVGEVDKVEGLRQNGIDLAKVDIELQPQDADVRKDAHVLLRPHGLFGPKFIDLLPGHTSSPKLAESGVIPAGQTTQPVDLDQVLQELQGPEQQQLRTVFIELGKAAQGRGDDVNHLLAAAQSLAPVLDDPVRSVDTVNGNLSDMLIKNEAFNASFAQAPLDQYVANSNHALEAFAANSQHLQSILVHANSSLNSLDQSLNGNVGNLRTTLEQLPSTLDRLNSFQDLLTIFGANLSGKEPGFNDVIPGIIGSIENIRSAFSSSDPCTPGQGTCPADGRSHYVRVQAFNVSPVNNPLVTGLCGTQPINGFLPCGPSTSKTSTAPVAPPATTVAADSQTLGSLFSP